MKERLMPKTLMSKMGVIASIIPLILITVGVTALHMAHAGTTRTDNSQEHLLTQLRLSKQLDRHLLQAIAEATTFARTQRMRQMKRAPIWQQRR